MNEHVKRINRSLVYGWLLIVLVLFTTYVLEVVKGELTLDYLLVFTALTALPALIVYLIYRRHPDNYRLRYEILVGYFAMYVFAMLTGSTNLVFCYILPMLSLLVLYHQPEIILYTGLAALGLNIAVVANRVVLGELNVHNTKDVEIQLALLFLCFFASYYASRLYGDIHRQNEEYTHRLNTQNEDIQRMTIQTIMTIANTIDAKDEYTRGHSRRVAEYAAAMAEELGLTEEEISDIRYIGLLHDIGKIGIPDSVLNKPGKLTLEEYQVMKNHTIIGSDILKDINMIEGLDIGARYHHERYDGKGYPEGLAGDDIPYIARIISVADAYDAMSSNRIYRRHLAPERVMEELRGGIGVQWDPRCVNALIRLLEENRLPEMRPETDMVRHATAILTRVISVAENSAAGGRRDRDELTGVYGRDAGRDAIQNAIYQLGAGWLMLFNVDHFHRINQTSGFAVGDACLRLLAELIEKAYPNNIVARFGSDEFAVFVPNHGDGSDAGAVARRFYRVLEEADAPAGLSERLSVSIGMTEVFTEKDRIMVLYENVNKALYVAKQKGGGTYYCHQVDTEEAEDDVADVDLRHLVEEASHGGTGAAESDFPDAARLHRLLERSGVESADFTHVALFTLENARGSNPSLDERDCVAELLHGIAEGVLPDSDVIMKYSSTQYAVFFRDETAEAARSAIERILLEFFKVYSKGELELHYSEAPLPAGTEAV